MQSLISWRISQCISYLSWNTCFLSQSYLGHGFGTVFEDSNWWWQSTSLLCQVLTQWEVYFGSHLGQYSQTLGLLQGKVFENLHWTQKRKVLYLCQLLGYWRKGEFINTAYSPFYPFIIFIIWSVYRFIILIITFPLLNLQFYFL